MGEHDDALPAIDDAPTLGDRDRLDELLYRHNAATTGLDDGRRWGIFLRDAEGAAVGGVHGWTWAGTCYVTTLFVPSGRRRQGLGRRLMAAAEAEAHARACDRLVVRTHEFQAPDFYRKLGFERVAEVAYPRRHREFTFVKLLVTSQRQSAPLARAGS